MPTDSRSPDDELSRTIVGSSPAVCALRAYLPRVAQSAATVLITGATGSGKERVAQAIHTIGPRAPHPFVAVNCAALPDALIESELFGHERGAFTGAIAAKVGYVARASRGTLFLDEIGELSVHAQAKLLRVLEDRSVQPIGAPRAVPVDVRVIAATNQPLELLLGRGGFRADLYYRLNVVRLDLPALKDRREDIPLLLGHAIQRLNERDRGAVGAPDPELLACLTAHDWPGNVRELNNLVEAIFIDPPRGRVRMCDLPPVFRQIFEQYRCIGTSERERLVGALEQTHWNKAEAAKQLKWSRMTLYRKLAKYQLKEAL
jgi:two-component system response regulator HydG